VRDDVSRGTAHSRARAAHPTDTAHVMLRRNRLYRIARAGLTIIAAVLRYLWLRVRARTPGLRPSERAWQRAHARTGRGINRLATGMGGAFVKLGQVLGARDDVMPPAMLAELRGLHDRVPPRSFASLRDHVERELGRPVDEVFDEIDEEALAAASLAQVHRARLRDGTDVVLKIQYPEARRLFPIDLGSLRRASRVARWLARVDLRPLVDELARQVTLELEFDREAASTERVRTAFDGADGVQVPRVHRDLSSDRLLVLDYARGTALTEVERLRDDGVDLRAVATAVADLYATMIFEHGFFHGDPHPGNLLLAPDRRTIVLLDFGMAKELPPGFGDGVATMIVKALAGDLDGAMVAARAIGFEAAGEPEAFRELVRALLGDNDRMRNALDSLRAASVKGIPADFALIGRALILLNGLSHRLAPGERLIASALARRMMPRVMAAQAAAASTTAAAATA